jgi:hypothetical protein
MSDQIMAASIAATATIIAALIAWLAKEKVQDRVSSKYRSALDLVDPTGHWKCDWLKGDGSLYVSDVVVVEGWVKDGRFRGKGTQAELSYAVDGEVDSTRVVALTYRTMDFPKKAYVGVACMIFNTDGNRLTGYWYGRAKSGEFLGGTTVWSRG